jgi:ABC-2 type transport system ATP-binding protein
MVMSTRGLTVEASGICKSFGTTRALDHVGLQAEEGRVLALLGPNGAGKTTLVRILATLLRADAGTARVGGHDVVAEAAAVRSMIGLSGQFAAVDDLLTGRENLEMLGELYHLRRPEARARAGELLARFGLTEPADRPARTYSGGMRRRLDLAGSLVGKPPVLILDEPTTGLDPPTRIGLWAMIAELVAGGTTVLLTTQYLEEADRLAHQIAILDRGRIIALGTAGELKSKAGSDIVEIRAADPAELDKAAAVLAPMGGGIAADRERGRATVPAADGVRTLRVVLDRLESAGVRVDDIGVRQPSLDDVFLALTSRPAATAGKCRIRSTP